MSMQIPPPDSWILPVWLAETTLIVAALAAAAWLASRSRRLGPTARHVLWLVVLVRFVIPPVVHWPWARPVHSPTVSLPSSVEADSKWQALPSDIAEPDRIEPAEPTPITNLPQPEPVWSDPVITAEAEAPGPMPLSAGPEAPKPDILQSDSALELWNLRQAWGYLLSAWLVGSLLVATTQARRIIAFRRRLKPGLAIPASDWLIEETGRIAGMLEVRPPPVWIVPGLTTPMLWCLGRPKLLIPRHLLKELDVSCWRGILAHELAHLRRGDHWVSRLELAAGLAWWWNPLYWFVRSRLDAEAELACDAWVVSLLPEERLTYADSLFQLCSELPLRSPTAIRVPALSVTGSGKFFEKRLTMILSDSVSCRTTAWNALAAALLMLVSVPAWTLANPPETTSVEAAEDQEQNASDTELDEPSEKAPAAPVPPVPPVSPVAPVAPVPPVHPDAPTGITSAGPGGLTLTANARPNMSLFLKDKDLAKQVKTAQTLKNKLEKGKEADIEGNMEALAEKMEAIVENVVEKAFGDEFEKRMEALGKDMEKKFGPGSDFEKAMKPIVKDMEKKFGPGSDFEKMMKSMAKDMEKQFGPGSDFEKSMKAQVQKMKAEASRAEHEDGPAAETARKEKSITVKANRNLARLKADARPERKPEVSGEKNLAKVEIPIHPSDGEKIAREDKEKAERDEAKAREEKVRAEKERAKSRADRERAMVERKAAQAKENEARATVGKERDRTRRIKLLEGRLQKLMEELKQLETEDQKTGG